MRRMALFFARGAVLAAASVPSRGQQPERGSSTAIDAVLEKLHSNLAAYQHDLPNLSCHERVRSFSFGNRFSDTTVTESTFRIQRQTGPEGEVEFRETRIVNTVDGKPARDAHQTLSGPATLSGAFSDTLEIVSTRAKGCFAYHLLPRGGGGAGKHGRAENAAGAGSGQTEPIVIEFSDLPKRERRPDCPPYEKISGRATIDATSMHLVKLESYTPFHLLTPGTLAQPGISGDSRWSIEYAPVPLLGGTFWLPQLIASRSTSADNRMVWTFNSQYSDYHLFHAEGRILP